jgi:hypothetical protein
MTQTARTLNKGVHFDDLGHTGSEITIRGRRALARTVRIRLPASSRAQRLSVRDAASWVGTTC